MHSLWVVLEVSDPLSHREVWQHQLFLSKVWIDTGIGGKGSTRAQGCDTKTTRDIITKLPLRAVHRQFCNIWLSTWPPLFLFCKIYVFWYGKTDFVAICMSCALFACLGSSLEGRFCGYLHVLRSRRMSWQ